MSEMCLKTRKITNIENDAESFLAGRIKELVIKHFVLLSCLLGYPCEDQCAAVICTTIVQMWPYGTEL